MPNSTLNTFSVQPYPDFGVGGPGLLTNNGKTLETILGGYYRLWLTKEGLLTGQDSTDANFVYFRANVLERTIDTAKAFATGLLPAASVTVNFYAPQESDPLFDPVGAGVARLDLRKALAAVKGRLGGSGQSLTSSYASELALTRSVLFGYPASQSPVPMTPAGKIDVTTIPIEITTGTPSMPVGLGGLSTVTAAVDPFLMEYAEGLEASSVGWGQLTVEGISQTTRLSNLFMDLETRTPYLAGVESSNLASHVVRSMLQAATGNSMTGSLGDPSTNVIVLIASDVNISALAGLFRLDWILPGYQPNYCTPGGALVFELRQSQSTGDYIVRASYIAQTLEQLRKRTALTLTAPPTSAPNSRRTGKDGSRKSTLTTPPASAPIFIPGCSGRDATFDCSLANFVKLANQVIDPRSADLMN